MISKALIIAIDAYPSILRLHGSLHDAEDVYSTLVRELGYVPERIRYLANEHATKKNILETMAWLSDANFAFCYYAGHGTLNTEKRPAIVSYDCIENWNDPIADKDIEATLGGMRGCMIFDCCHSGSLCTSQTDGFPCAAPVVKGNGRYFPNPLLPDAFAPDMGERVEKTLATPTPDVHLWQNNMVYMSACRDLEISQEIPIKAKTRGIFTYHLCQSFRTEKDKPLSRHWEWAAAAVQSAHTDKDIIPQHPQLWCHPDYLDKTIKGAFA